MEICKRRAELILTAYREVAAVKLVTLTDCDKEVTARQACLDILSMENKKSGNTGQEAPRLMSKATQEAILKIMADEKGSPPQEVG